GPGERVTHYRQSCLACHTQRGCSLPEPTRRLKSKEDSCIDCHMPQYPPSDIGHTAATDHRIVRSSDIPLPRTERNRGERRPKRDAAIVPFYRQGPNANDADADRDLGIALVHVMVQSITQRKAPPAGATAQAVDLLTGAARNDPGDLPACEAQAESLALLDRQPEALAAYEKILAKAPHRETALTGAAMLAQKQQQLDLALSCWRRAVAEDPWQPYYRESLAKMLVEQKAWEDARPHAEAWVHLDPASVEARVLWVTCLARSGDKVAARAEFAKI